jgi:prepilin-type N-terminal cleavage/methylation domain-containing protein
MKTKFYNRGFTLAEISVAVMVFGLVSAGMMSFVVVTLRCYYTVTNRVRQAGNITSLSSDLIYNASRANQFFLYKSPTAADWADPTKELSIDASNNHPAGDFVVYVFYELPKADAQPYHRIKKIVGYFLLPTNAADPNGGYGPIRKITIDLSSGPLADYDSTVPAGPRGIQTSVEKIIAANWNSVTNVLSTHATLEDFVASARGLLLSETDTSGVGRMFYYRTPSSLMVSGQIFMSKSGFPTNDWKTYTDTFNFSITPRS